MRHYYRITTLQILILGSYFLVFGTSSHAQPTDPPTIGVTHIAIGGIVIG